MEKSPRRYDIDWLRVFAMLTIFLYHCARFFNEEDWHVKNNELSFGISVAADIVAQWTMPLFFVISAISAYYALGRRDAGQFVRERLKRLVVPLVFGSFVIIAPLQVWIERVSHGDFSGSFLEFYFPHYFRGFYAFGGNFAWMGLHLWYLGMLFLFSLITLPLFLHLRGDRMHGRMSRLAGFFSRPGAIFLLAIPLVIIGLLVNLQPGGIGRRDFGGWSPLMYLVFFILGYLVACDPQFKRAIERQRVAALALGVATTLLGAYLLLSETVPSSRHALMAIVRGCNSWFWLVAILGFGSRYLGFTNRALKYSNEAVLPFYIMHQTMIVAIGFLIADWSLGVMTKYLILSVSSFVVIVGIYQLAIKRVTVLRVLFGMRLK
jgi:glucan biosynthesis protein C